MTTVTMIEFTSQVGNPVPVKMRARLAVVTGSGIGDSGWAAASGSVFRELASWMTNG